MSVPRSLLLPAIAVLLASGTALFAIRHIDRASDTVQLATVFPEPLALPDFSMLDQDGREFTRASLRGHTSLMFFGFTHCPDICPATLQQLAFARRELAGRRGGTGPLPEIILISVDPERDAPGILKAYTANFGEGVSGISAGTAELQKLTAALGIYYAREDGSGSDYTVNHSTAVLLINREAELQAVFTAPLDTAALVSDLQVLVDAG